METVAYYLFHAFAAHGYVTVTQTGPGLSACSAFREELSAHLLKWKDASVWLVLYCLSLTDENFEDRLFTKANQDLIPVVTKKHKLDEME